MNTDDTPPLGPSAPRSVNEVGIEREIKALKAMVMAEAAAAVGMIEQASEALLNRDETLARIVI
ncbi:MAG: hypothetical protein ACK51T_04730, partial [bacterium]